MTAVDQLIAYANLADPFRNAPEDLAALQLAALRERFAERRQQIKVLDKRAREMGIAQIDSLHQAVPLLFAHTNYKSYPEAFIDSGQWRHMNLWLGTLSAYPTNNIDVTGVADVDGWLSRARDAGHYLFASSGTSGKSSFLNQSARERALAVSACLAAFDLSTPGFTPNHDRQVFTMMPTHGTHKMIEVSSRHFERWAAPGQLHRLSNDPILAWDSMRPAQLRRLLAAGKIGPGEIAAHEAAVAAYIPFALIRFSIRKCEAVNGRHSGSVAGMFKLPMPLTHENNPLHPAGRQGTAPTGTQSSDP
jgi:hypothetical protein